MKIVNTYANLTGKQLLDLVTDDGSAVEINGNMVLLTPRTLPFCNQAEISSIDDADYVAVRTRWSNTETLVRV